MVSTAFATINNSQLRSLLDKDGPFPFAFTQARDLPVYSVDHIHLTFLNLNGKEVLLVTAYGTTATSGWTDARLQPYIYVQPPTDGIWDMVLVATPPSGISYDALTPVATTFVWQAPYQGLKGVRIHSATNTLEEKIKDQRNNVTQVTTKHVIGQKAA